MDGGAPKSLVNQAKNRYIFLWEHDVAGSNPVIPTKKGHLSHSDLVSFSFFVRFQSSMYDFVTPNPVSPLANVAFRPKTDLTVSVGSVFDWNDVSNLNLFCRAKAGSHSPLGDRQASLSGGEGGNHGA